MHRQGPLHLAKGISSIVVDGLKDKEPQLKEKGLGKIVDGHVEKPCIRWIWIEWSLHSFVEAVTTRLPKTA